MPQKSKSTKSIQYYPIINGTRTCYKCLETKSMSEYDVCNSERERTIDGYRLQCHKCKRFTVNLAQRKRYAKRKNNRTKVYRECSSPHCRTRVYNKNDTECLQCVTHDVLEETLNKYEHIIKKINKRVRTMCKLSEYTEYIKYVKEQLHTIYNT